MTFAGSTDSGLLTWSKLSYKNGLSTDVLVHRGVWVHNASEGMAPANFLIQGICLVVK